MPNLSLAVRRTLPIVFSVLALTSVRADTLKTVGSSTIAAPPTSSTWSQTRITVAKCTKPPVIDGKLDDPCWATATHIAGFYREMGSTPITQQTEAWLCADTTHLYVAFHCLDSQPDRIKAAEVRRNGSTYLDDYVQLFIDSQDTHHYASQFQVTARGTQRESIEGGTPDNITWVGDWRAAAQRTKDGWSCEMSIPFGLLRHPRDARSFGISLTRKLSREIIRECWPSFPPGQYATDPQYFCQAGGLTLPYYAPRPVVLPYVLATAGDGSASREGVDVKYPLNTSLTAVATLFPDFQTVEQDVVGINFTYDAKYLEDRRPFFAEGSNYFSDSSIFYSPSIGQVDSGLKVVGKEDNTGLAMITTDDWQAGNGRTTQALVVGQDLGAYSHAEVDYAGDNEEGAPSNRVGKLEGTYGWKVGQEVWSMTANDTPSWEGGQSSDGKMFAGFNIEAPDGKPGIYANYQAIGPRFVSDLGYVPEINLRGYDAGFSQFNRFNEGKIELYDVGFDASTYEYDTGGFFHDIFSPYAIARDRDGVALLLSPSLGQRHGFHDHTLQTELRWGRKTIYQRGSIGDTAGDMDGQTYNFFTATEGVLESRSFTSTANYNIERLGSMRQTQAVLNGTFQLTSERSVSLRLVQQTGNGPDGTNIFLAYAQQSRSGADIYLLVGDPNSLTTHDVLTVKIIKPF